MELAGSFIQVEWESGVALCTAEALSDAEAKIRETLKEKLTVDKPLTTSENFIKELTFLENMLCYSTRKITHIKNTVLINPDFDDTSHAEDEVIDLCKLALIEITNALEKCLMNSEAFVALQQTRYEFREELKHFSGTKETEK